ncbi:glycosyltransferase family 4 protein [Prosthecochloris sp. SCSIO W1103]|uniref:glycosyltransferase family 4 protein n=1 Tax=Prosthecochloris sp. SCSIO W1103 TaxID=2992244 RepID=UPI00223D7F9A|nr:glycosyltransferase family 4 protein [Prosthecochloris sp. SCSIO W1103]UZJ37309.1 glycosyltransferase family 4 protein [Prosthecochloris sp. SCSIO W1103]
MNLALFFSKNVSLKTWLETGMFDREIALYKKHEEKGINSSFITYDKEIDVSISSKISSITVLHNRFHLSANNYHRLCPLLHTKALKNTDIIKTNQISGSLAAVRAAHLFKKPLVARCGYMHSEFSIRESGAKSRKTKRKLAAEHRLFTNADAIIVTTNSMKKSIVSRLPGAEHKITVIPNYVDTQLFKPKKTQKEYDVIFIGRFSEQKNLHSLLETVTQLNCKTLIIGHGSNAQKLHNQYPSAQIHWLGNIPNSHLPDYINKAKVFVLPSHYEGHPKTLIEAMACGSAVVGSDAPGIREVISHNNNGLLTKNDSASLLGPISRLLKDTAMVNQLGQKARCFAIKNYSLEVLAEKENQLLKKLIQH